MAQQPNPFDFGKDDPAPSPSPAPKPAPILAQRQPTRASAPAKRQSDWETVIEPFYPLCDYFQVPRKPGYLLFCLSLLAGLFFVFLIVVVAIAHNSTLATAAKYNAIHEGMHYNQVVQIMGSHGHEISRAGGLQMVQWRNWGGSNITCTFDNGFLVAKAQFGL